MLRGGVPLQKSLGVESRKDASPGARGLSAPGKQRAQRRHVQHAMGSTVYFEEITSDEELDKEHDGACRRTEHACCSQEERSLTSALTPPFPDQSVFRFATQQVRRWRSCLRWRCRCTV